MEKLRVRLKIVNEIKETVTFRNRKIILGQKKKEVQETKFLQQPLGPFAKLTILSHRLSFSTSLFL